jgi:hypothetical protein
VRRERFITYCTNPDKRCKYPRYPEGSHDYCWTYANHIDGEAGFEDLVSHCRKCELFEEAAGVGA